VQLLSCFEQRPAFYGHFGSVYVAVWLDERSTVIKIVNSSWRGEHCSSPNDMRAGTKVLVAGPFTVSRACSDMTYKLLHITLSTQSDRQAACVRVRLCEIDE
jgi:hypothetical protein